jgi:hypothetical protein
MTVSLCPRCYRFAGEGTTDSPVCSIVCATCRRLEELRAAIRAENISYGEIAELQGYGEAGHIPEGDVELREWAGLPEFPDVHLTWPRGGLVCGATTGEGTPEINDVTCEECERAHEAATAER